MPPVRIEDERHLRHRPRRLAVLLLALVVGSSLGWLRLHLGSSHPAPVDLRYTVEIADPEDAILRVRLRIEGAAGPRLHLGFSSNAVARNAPAAKFRVRNAEADGRPAPIEHETGEWIVRGAGRHETEIEYEVHLGAGHEASPYADVALSRLDGDGGRLLGSDVFLFPTSISSESIEVDYRLPPGWQLFHPFAVSATTVRPPSLRALYYSAGAVGRHRTLAREVDGVYVEIAVRGNYAFGDDDLMEMISRVARQQLEFFGQSPRRRYLFVVEPHPQDRDPRLLHYFGLHFDASMIVLLDPRTDRRRLQNEPASLCAHEFFHNWMGEQLATDELSMNWFIEGITTFYADRTRIAVRMLDRGRWAQELQERYRADWVEANVRKAVSVADAGRLVLQDPEITRMLYVGGRFVALALDQEIVRATGARSDLDDLVLGLVDRAVADPRFRLTRSALETAYRSLTGEELGPWLDRYVYGRAELPLPGYVVGR